MREYVTFSSKVFSKAATPDTINRVGRCEDVAVWLERRLHAAIAGARTTRYQEDFGWVLEMTPPHQARPLMVVAGNLDEDDEDTDEFAVYVEPLQAAREQTDEVIAAVDQALHDDPTIDRIQWWDGGFMGGQPTDCADEVDDHS